MQQGVRYEISQLQVIKQKGLLIENLRFEELVHVDKSVSVLLELLCSPFFAAVAVFLTCCEGFTEFLRLWLVDRDRLFCRSISLAVSSVGQLFLGTLWIAHRFFLYDQVQLCCLLIALRCSFNLILEHCRGFRLLGYKGLSVLLLQSIGWHRSAECRAEVHLDLRNLRLLLVGCVGLLPSNVELNFIDRLFKT